MLLKSLALAASATALLVAPNVPVTDDDIVKALSANDLRTLLGQDWIYSRKLSVPCHSCEDSSTELHFDFTISEDEKLLANGFELYPTSHPWDSDLAATVVSGTGKSDDQVLGYSLSMVPRLEEGEGGASLVDITLQVIEVGNVFVIDIPAIQISLMETPSGRLYINSAEMGSAATLVEETKCTSMWCQTKDFFNDIFSGFKGCGGMKKPIDDEYELSDELDGFEIIDLGDVDDGWFTSMEMDDEDDRSWGEILMDIGWNDVVPGLMGIFAGMGVAFIALFVSSMVIRTVRFITGASDDSSESSSSPKAAPEYAIYDDEKTVLTLADDELPRYEDAPKM